MTVANAATESRPADTSQARLENLMLELSRVRAHMLEQADGLIDAIQAIDPSHRPSAVNLAHYLGLRQHDLRSTQEALAELGLSSLGRCEDHALASVEAVLRAGHALLGGAFQPHVPAAPPVTSAADGRARLEAQSAALLGPEPDGRRVRVMVTLPTEAAIDYPLVRDLVASGMNCARINCAHDDVDLWRRMAAHVRQAGEELGKPCRVLVDVAGPKLRTGDLPLGPAVVRWRPHRDKLGTVVSPAEVWLTAEGRPSPARDSADACVPVPGAWLAQLQVGDNLELRDARGKRRRLIVTRVRADGCWAQATQTAYVIPTTRVRIARRADGSEPEQRTCCLEAIAPSPNAIVLRVGDRLMLTTAAAGTESGTEEGTQRIPCSLPDALTGLRPGEPIWFDDGTIGGRIRRVSVAEVEVEITHAKPTGSKLRADRSINLPESELERAPLLPKDFEDLAFVAEHADLVGLSFAESTAGVEQLAAALRERTSRAIGIVLKIETRRGFERLPQLLFSAMRHDPVGVMIARGDLAVECGYERLAEVQEEMLWLCEAAHIPVIWATQVLDQLTRTGQPSRAEITDAAMSERAECVMLNKGPYVVEAVRALSDILTRMQAHQHKKSALFRKLHVSELDDLD